MATGLIYITGQIGHSYNGDGSIAVKGVTVADVVAQYAAQPNCEKYEVWINSPGGSVDEGMEMGKVTASIPNCFTIADELCASIATVPFLSVPVENRSIIEGSAFMIHNPLLMSVSGNASELKWYASQLEPMQKDLLNIYVKATGASKENLQSLMNVETVLTADQAVSMGFASAITPKKQYKAVAFFTQPNEITTEMEKKSFLDSLNIFKAKAKAMGVDLIEAPTRNAVALVLESDKGSITTPYDDMMVGDPVTMTETGETAPDDTYTMPDGMVVVVVGGVVDSMVPVADGELQAQYVALKEENEALKAQLAEQETAMAQVATAMEAIEAKAIRSTHVPATGAVAFRPQTVAAVAAAKKEGVTKEALAEARANLKTTKK